MTNTEVEIEFCDGKLEDNQKTKKLKNSENKGLTNDGETKKQDRENQITKKQDIPPPPITVKSILKDGENNLIPINSPITPSLSKFVFMI